MNLFSSWKGKIENYVDVRLGILKLSIIERTSTLLATVIMAFIFLAIGLAILAFVGWGLMEVFITLLDSRVGGAFMTAGVFAVLLIILFLLRRILVASFAGIFITILTHEIDVEEEEINSLNKKGDGK